VADPFAKDNDLEQPLIQEFLSAKYYENDDQTKEKIQKNTVKFCSFS